MDTVALTPEHRTAAPGLAARIRVLFTGLATLIARGLLKNPRYVAVILPLWNHLSRAANRFDRLMARVAAGTEQPRRRPAAPHTGPRGANPYRFPAPRAWLLAALRHEAAFYANRIRELLADPQIAQLVAATPQAQGILRPICHMLGIQDPAVPPLPRKRPPSPPPVPAALARAAAPEPTANLWTAPPRAAPEARDTVSEPLCHHRLLWPFPFGRPKNPA